MLYSHFMTSDVMHFCLHFLLALSPLIFWNLNLPFPTMSVAFTLWMLFKCLAAVPFSNPSLVTLKEHSSTGQRYKVSAFGFGDSTLFCSIIWGLMFVVFVFWGLLGGDESSSVLSFVNKHCERSCELLRYMFWNRFETNFQVVSNLFEGSSVNHVNQQNHSSSYFLSEICLNIP